MGLEMSLEMKKIERLRKRNMLGLRMKINFIENRTLPLFPKNNWNTTLDYRQLKLTPRKSHGNSSKDTTCDNSVINPHATSLNPDIHSFYTQRFRIVMQRHNKMNLKKIYNNHNLMWI